MAPRLPGVGELLRRYTARVASWPGRVLAVEFALLLAVVAIIVAGGFFEITQESGRSWLIPGNREVRRQDAVRAARKLRAANETTSYLEREANGRDIGTVYIVYHSRKGNMLTPENLAAMRDVEAKFTGHHHFPKYCQLVYPQECVPGDDLPECTPSREGPECARPVSLVEAVFDSNGEQRELGPVLRLMAENLYLSGFYLSKEFSRDNLRSSYVRSMIPLGAPLHGYERPGSKRKEQAQTVYQSFIKSVETELHPHLGLKKSFMRPARMREGLAPNGDVEVVYWSDGTERIEMNELSQQDFLWAILSMLCVAIYMVLHTRSVFISVVGMLEIILSIPLAFFVYRLVFQIRFFSFMHILAVFVLLGIGADDVFVFVDAFKQSASEPDIDPTDLNRRIEYTAFRASKAVLLTSLTTTAAFLATAISEILPISTFGIFAALCISLLYLLNVLLMPPALVIWVKYMGGGGCQPRRRSLRQGLMGMLNSKTTMLRENLGTAKCRTREGGVVTSRAWTSRSSDRWRSSSTSGCPISSIAGACPSLWCSLVFLLQAPDSHQNFRPQKRQSPSSRAATRSSNSSNFQDLRGHFLRPTRTKWRILTWYGACVVWTSQNVTSGTPTTKVR